MSDAISYNKGQLAAGKITPVALEAMTRLWQRVHGLNRDGECGPITQASAEEARSEPETRSVQMTKLSETVFQVED